jgi:hypothetical protein
MPTRIDDYLAVAGPQKDKLYTAQRVMDVLDRGASDSRYNIIDYGVQGGGVDDTAPIQRAIDDACSAGGGEVFFPEGVWTTNTQRVSNNRSWTANLAVWADNVIFRGVGDASILKSTLPNHASQALLGVSGGAKPLGKTGWEVWGDHDIADVTKVPVLALAPGTYQRGSNSVILASSSDAATFNVGDLIYIRTGQLLGAAAGTNREPDSETNTVIGVSGFTITLKYPLCKTYEQEYYNTGTTGVTSTTVTANPAPFGVARVTDYYINGFGVVDMQIHAGFAGIFVTQTRKMRFHGFNTNVGRFSIGGNNWSKTQASDCNFHNNDPSYGSYAFAPATGSHDILCSNVNITSDGFTFLHIHEGTSRLRYLGGSILNAIPGGAGKHAVDIAARGYDIGIDGTTINTTGSSAGSGLVHVQGSGEDESPRGVDGGGYVTNCTLIENQAGMYGVRIGQNSRFWRVRGNEHIGTIAVTGDNLIQDSREQIDPRYDYKSTAAHLSNIPRIGGGAITSANPLTNGTLYLTSFALPVGTVITSLAFVGGVIAMTPGSSGDQWFCLLDDQRNFLAITSDDGITAWGSQARKTLPIISVAGGVTGAASSYTTKWTGRFYCGILISQTGGSPVMPNMSGTVGAVGVNQLSPPVAGITTSTYTTPPDISGATVTANTITTSTAPHVLYCEIA